MLKKRPRNKLKRWGLGLILKSQERPERSRLTNLGFSLFPFGYKKEGGKVPRGPSLEVDRRNLPSRA